MVDHVRQTDEIEIPDSKPTPSEDLPPILRDTPSSPSEVQTQEKVGLVQPASPQVIVQAAEGFLLANNLYDKAKALIRDRPTLEAESAKILIEYATDAIKEFGNTNQDKKIELRKIIEDAQKVLPPETIDALRKRAEGQALKKLHRGPIGRWTLMVIAFAVIILALVLYARSLWGAMFPESKSVGVQDAPASSVVHDASESPGTPIYEGFRPLYRSEYGNAQPEQPQRFTYYGVHQRAIVIWFEDLNAFYKLKLQPQEWERYMDPDRNPDPKFGDLTWRLSQDWSLDESRPPDGYQPPFSGVAKNWLAEPEKWKWIGFLSWHCNYVNYENPPIHYQEFRDAIMLGGFRSSQSGTDTRVFILRTNGHSWTSPQLPMSAPDCARPEEMYAKSSR